MPDWLKPSFLCVEASVDLPQACMTDSVKRLLEVYEVVEQVTLVLSVLLYNDSTIVLLCSGLVLNLLVLLPAVPQPWP